MIEFGLGVIIGAVIGYFYAVLSANRDWEDS